MAPASRANRRAVVLSLVAAFCWALYFPFVLGARAGASPAATMFYPFAIGGAAYAVYALAQGFGRPLLGLWAQPAAWLRTGLMVAMQLSVLAGTYLAGPVDMSLLSLIGDVVLTPIFVAYLWTSHRGNIGSQWFTVGLALSLVGGTLTIVGGETLGKVQGLGWLVVPIVPLAVAAYFLLTAMENERSPPPAVAGQSVAAAALLTFLVSPLLPGGLPSLATVTPTAFGLLAACGLTSFFLAYVLYFRAISESGIVIPPMMMTGIPVFTLLLSAFVLGLGLPLLAVLGIPVAVAGALLTLRAESTPEPPPPGAAASG